MNLDLGEQPETSAEQVEQYPGRIECGHNSDYPAITKDNFRALPEIEGYFNRLPKNHLKKASQKLLRLLLRLSTDGITQWEPTTSSNLEVTVWGVIQKYGIKTIT